ncbi:MAG: hypothetical protein AAF376_20530, partial [Pseudomonadota bacterium]
GYSPLAPRAAARGAAVAVVLHDLNLAAAFADRIALMAKGRIIAAGAPSEVFTARRLSETYGTALSVQIGSDDRPRITPRYDVTPAQTSKEIPHVHRHEPLSRPS